MQPQIITLTTDFGSMDTYVAQMKGAIVGINPAARIIDVTHGIPPQDLFRGALALDEIVDCFPDGTVHVAVVDPGVGSQRRIIAVELGQQRFVLPDNGLIERVRQRLPIRQIVEVTEATFFRRSFVQSEASESEATPISNTFHGRDIMAPVAAHLSLGVEFEELGPTVREDSLCELAIPDPIVTDHSIIGHVVWTDSFGNLITNIDAGLIPSDQFSNLQISIGLTEIIGIRHTYSDVAAGQIMALINSSGRLEIAVNGGRACEFVGRDSNSADVRVTFSTIV